MTPKKYEQPYCSKHVVHNTKDAVRQNDPVFIRNFPRMLHLLYRKQTPFNSTVLNAMRQLGESRSASRKSTSRGSPTSPKTSNEAAGSNQKTTHLHQQQQYSHPPNFKTLAPKSAKSPTPTTNQQISAMPSDFEHIFHYSEAQ